MAAGDRVIVVVPTAEEFQQIQEILDSEQVVVEHASCLLGAVLAHVQAQISAGDAGRPAMVILYDTDSPEHWRGAMERFLVLNPGTQVILLSRVADEGMWMEVLDTGGRDLLPKPASSTEICGAVRRALGSAHRYANAA